MFLQLRGLCPDSRMDRYIGAMVLLSYGVIVTALSGRFYVPSNKKRSGYVILVGLRSSIIEYSKETLSWQLVEQTHNTTATAED